MAFPLHKLTWHAASHWASIQTLCSRGHIERLHSNDIPHIASISIGESLLLATGELGCPEPNDAVSLHMKYTSEPGTTCTPSIFLLVENRLLREALAGIVRKQPDLSVAGVDRSTADAQKQVAEMQCDILLVHQ
jgi:hypothetical protein